MAISAGVRCAMWERGSHQTQTPTKTAGNELVYRYRYTNLKVDMVPGHEIGIISPLDAHAVAAVAGMA